MNGRTVAQVHDDGVSPGGRSGRSPVRAVPAIVAAALAAVLVSLLASACGDDGDAADASSSDSPPKITVAGDSISVGLGSELRGIVGDDATVKVIGEVGTGLARADKFDWPTRLRQLADEFPPDVLVLSLGSNDAQDLTDASGDVVVPFADHDEWDAEYSRRLAESFDAFESTGTRVVWVGHVRTEEELVGDTNRHVHELATQVAADRPWVEVADLAELLGTGDAVAEDCLRDDGLHLTVECLRRADEALRPTLLP